MSDEGRCRTCIHWTGLEYPAAASVVTVYRRDEETGRSVSERVKVDDGALLWGECEAPSGPDYEGASKLMQVWDASSYAAGLKTRDTFGCIEHAPRPD